MNLRPHHLKILHQLLSLETAFTFNDSAVPSISMSSHMDLFLADPYKEISSQP
jgi:hypothetical protein